MKICRICKNQLDLSNFHKSNFTKDGLKSECKECRRLQAKQYRSNPDNKEKIKATIYSWRAKNPSHIKEQREKIARKFGTPNHYSLVHQKVNREKVNEKRRIKYKEDPLYKIKCDIRSLISHVFKDMGFSKNSSTQQIVGISYEDFYQHLINTCRVNYGNYDSSMSYHIDHIIPISCAKTEEDVIKLNHYSNLQLLTEEDNLKKGSKIIDSPF